MIFELCFHRAVFIYFCFDYMVLKWILLQLYKLYFLIVRSSLDKYVETST